MRSIRILLVLLMSAVMSSAYCQEEFIGPFPSWANVKTRFRAAGNGVKDDTKSLQDAIDSLSVTVKKFNSGNRGYSVVYLPKGVYNISKTLNLRGKIGISIIGEDPANTIIRWTGGDKDTLLWANGSAYFKIARLTFDGNDRKNIEGIGIHWMDKWNLPATQSFASLNIEISDILFNRLSTGIGGGTFGEGTSQNDSEITIRRCTFNRTSAAAITIRGYNALDYWIWDSKFIECYVGVSCRAGNYHIYNSYFKKSVLSDVLTNNSYYSSMRNCYSTGSRAFHLDEGYSCNPFKRVLQGNTVISPDDMPVQYYHLGSITLLDNAIDASRMKEVDRHVNHRSGCPGHYTMLSVGNLYRYPGFINLNVPEKTIFTHDDVVTTRAFDSEADFMKSMPGTPVKVSRKIFEIQPNSSSTMMQRIIDQAASLKGTKPVVHFAFGQYEIDETLVIPPGSDMQLMGDGLIYASVLSRKAKLNDDPLMIIKGPSQVNLAHLQLQDGTGRKGKESLIVFENIDQQFSGLFIDQLYSQSDTSIAVKGLNYLYIENNNSFFSSGNSIQGGSVQQSGKGTLQWNSFGGQFAGLSISGNANFYAKDCWWEGQEKLPVDLHGNGNVSIDGAMLAPAKGDSTTTIRIGKFSGRVSLMNMYVQGGMEIAPANDQLKILVWNIHFYHKMDPLSFIKKNATYKGLFIGCSVQCFDQKKKECANPVTIKEKTVNVKDRVPELFIAEMLAPTRIAIPFTSFPSKAGQSAVRITRLTLGASTYGIKILNR